MFKWRGLTQMFRVQGLIQMFRSNVRVGLLNSKFDQDISPEAADEACHRAWATSDRSRRCVLLPVPRGERDKQGWDTFWANYIKGNSGLCHVHVAYSKVPLGAEINIEHGIADISLCLSLVRNSKSERAVAGDLVILLVSSNVSAFFLCSNALSI